MKKHSNKALTIVIIFSLFMSTFPNISGTSYSDIQIDGNLSDWAASDFLGQRNGAGFAFTWSEDNLYFYWNGTDFYNEIEGADIFLYFSTSNNGSNLSKSWNFVEHNLPFSANYGLSIEDSNYYEFVQWNGSSWNVIESSDIEMYIGWSGNKASEIKLPLSYLGNPSNISLMAWAQWQHEANVWSSFPMLNSASETGAEYFTHYYSTALVENISSSEIQILSNSLKLDDAINLAIIFHQHQPYYKNKVTNFYELPWVRTHALVEYVDSPGILSQYPGTKITYNIVPSLIEQLIDYNENETLDRHTDWAKRPLNNETGYPEMTQLELHTMQFEYFWNSGWIYNSSLESSKRYKYLWDKTLHNLKPDTIMNDQLLPPQEFLDLQVLWFLFQFSPAYIAGEYNSEHFDHRLVDLFNQNGNYTRDDLEYVLDLQHERLADVLPMYSILEERGQVELTTTPYYHPIMPLLMMDGWTFEDGIYVGKDSWPEDVEMHLNKGVSLFQQHTGVVPSGMWPSEQAVSPAMVQPVSNVGIDWMVSDEMILEQSKDVNGLNPNVEDPRVLFTPWKATGDEGGEVSVIFRDRVISDRIAFEYGSMEPVDAVDDFLGYMDNVRQELLDLGENPSEHLITVALDGENWMFMSEFQQNDNARPFVHEWYKRLESHPSVVTVTPTEFINDKGDFPELSEIAVGSWIDGTLSTWAGEEDESLGWKRLVEARKSLVEFESANPTHPGLPTAWESLYIAEGSDWFWWYGLDQDSGYDELWDLLFKTHLSNIYRAVDLDLPVYLQDIWTSPAIPDIQDSSVIEPSIDGTALPGEWDGAARFSFSDNDNQIKDLWVGYDTQSVFVRIDTLTSPLELSESYNSNPTSSNPSVDLALYFMEPNAINFNEVNTNFRTYYDDTVLGFPAKWMLAIQWDMILSDGRGSYTRFEATGEENWVSRGTSLPGTLAIDSTIEIQIPYEDLELSPRYSTRLKAVFTETTSFTEGNDLQVAPSAPAELVIPDLEDWILLLNMSDQLGDENGDGNYLYPLSSDFTPGEGLWDIKSLHVYESPWNVKFEIEMKELTNFWGLKNGFSHQIVQIYIDKDNVTGSGETDALEGVYAEIHEDWAWEIALSATGEPGAVKSVIGSTGETSAKGVDASGSKDSNTIEIIASKNIVGSDIGKYKYILILGSQDGFGTGKWRDVDASSKSWRLGGGHDVADDGYNYDSNILDMVLPEGVNQQALLSSYSVDNREYAQLTGFYIPSVEQQIYGISTGVITGNTALVQWSTTQAANSSVRYSANNSQTWSVVSSDSKNTQHSILIDNLEPSTLYNLEIISGSVSADYQILTNSLIDTTPPQMLNFEIFNNDNEFLSISWYTDEKATEKIIIDKDGTISEIDYNDMPVNKNHIYILENLTSGNYKIQVYSEDSSGNGNFSEYKELTIKNNADSTVNSDEDSSNNDVNEDSILEVLFSPRNQIVILSFMILFVVSLFRAYPGGRND